jgi:type II secretory pathway component GspD/PulD (secretin)
MTLHRLTLRAVLALALFPLSLAAHAQAADAKPSDCSRLPTHNEEYDCINAHSEVKTIYLTHVTSQNDFNEIMGAIRNTSYPGLQIYLDVNQNALVVRTYPEEMARIEALIHSLDRPQQTYRITYTLTELDGGKTIGTAHYSMVVSDGQHTTMKEGDKIPVATGSYANGQATSNTNSGVETQFTYLDIGMNFDTTLNASEGGAMLKTKVEQSSLGQPSTIAGVVEPVVRQSVLEGTSFLPLGKPVMLGSIDVPNSTRHFDIAAVLDRVKD